MKIRILLSVILFSAFPAFAVLAEEAGKLSGEVSATGTLTSVVGSKAKFNEYRDIRDGVYGGVKARYDSEKYYLDLNARDMGYDTQRYGLDGGRWGDFKFHLNYEEIPHNFTYDAKTFYNGAGSSTLTFPGASPNTDTNTWNTFDYSTKRKNYGGGFKIDSIRPFFFDASVSQEDRRGTYPLGVAGGTNPGTIDIELPAPIHYKTDGVNFAAGYVRNPLFLSIGYFYSEFRNSNPDLHFINPTTVNTASATDTFTMPPDNHYYKLNLKGGLRLPLNSKFDVDLSTASAKSDRNLMTSYVADVPGGLRTIQLSNPNFNGQIDTRHLGLALTSKPWRFLDGKVFLKYHERENKSDQITTTDLAESPTTFTNQLFDYRKVNYGLELGFRLPARFYLSTIYKHSDISRQRDDIPKNRDDLYGAELRWKGLDFMTARVGYERLNTFADFHAPNVSTSDPTYIETFIRRFDAAGKSRDTYKAYLDLLPMENLTVSLGYKYKETNYSDTILGVRSDKRDEFAVDADYLVGKRVRFYGFFDYDRIRRDQFERQLPFDATSGFDPSTAPTTTAFNWTANQKDESYSYAVGTDIFIIPGKLTLKLQHSYLESNGSVDYTYLLGSNPLPTGRTQENIDLSNWDNYKLRYYLVKLAYEATKAFSLAAGYIYEKYIYSDAQYDGYQYLPVIPVTGTNGAYLTGAYSSPSYESHVVFLTLTYKF